MFRTFDWNVRRKDVTKELTRITVNRHCKSSLEASTSLLKASGLYFTPNCKVFRFLLSHTYCYVIWTFLSAKSTNCFKPQNQEKKHENKSQWFNSLSFEEQLQFGKLTLYLSCGQRDVLYSHNVRQVVIYFCYRHFSRLRIAGIAVTRCICGFKQSQREVYWHDFQRKVVRPSSDSSTTYLTPKWQDKKF